MTVSPTAPVPRVAPTASTPLRYTQLMAVPSIFSSHAHRMSVPAGRPRCTRSAHARRSASPNTLSSDCIASRCSNGGNASSSGEPTCCVGESGVCSTGNSPSIASSSWMRASNSASGIARSDST